MISEAKFGLDNGLTLFAHVHTLSEKVGVLIEEEKRETRHVFLLAGREHLDLILLVFVVVFEYLHWAPDVIFVFIYW